MDKIFGNKAVVISAGSAAVLSLLLGVIAGKGIVKILIQMIISGIAIGALVFLIGSFGSKLFPAEALDALKGKKSSGSGETSLKPESGKNLDLTDDGELSHNDLYSASEEDSEEVIPSTPSSEPDEQASFSTSPSGGFQEETFENAPRIQTESSGSEDVSEETFRETASNQTTLNTTATQDLSHAGEVSFEVGDKKINADPKVIAKAIKTVLHRD